MVSTRIESIDVPGGGAFNGHLTVPDAGRGPGILLLQEIFGVGEFILAKAEDLAGLGYVVLSPDVFWRIEPGFTADHDEAGLQAAFGLMGRFAEEVDDATKAADLAAALAHLRSLPEVAGEKVAAMGYCLGGRLAYEVAVASDPDACVSYYGSGIADRLDDAGAITCPVLFHFGGDDPFIPQDQVDAIVAAFADRDDVRIEIHAGAGHAFENSFAEQFSNPSAAEASWKLTTEFLADVLR
jgi:carboxymethylenebutenolidase